MTKLFLIVITAAVILISCTEKDLVQLETEQAEYSSNQKSKSKVSASSIGEFYSYSSSFTKERPNYFMMSCKANKDLPTSMARAYPNELDLTFIFNEKKVVLSSPNASIARSVNGVERSETLNTTDVRIANISEATFYDCYNKMDEQLLVDIFDKTEKAEKEIELAAGMILSVKTQIGEYGLILINSVSENAVEVDACHILL